MISLSDGIYPHNNDYFQLLLIDDKLTSQNLQHSELLSFLIDSQVPGTARADPPQCLSLAWSADGQTLFAGYSDNLIRVWQVQFFCVLSFFYGIPESVAHALKLAL